MASFTFLVNDLIATTENDASEFLAYMPNIVTRAEERLVKELDDAGLVTHTSVAVSAGNNIMTLPVGTRVIKNVNVKTATSRVNLLQRTDEYLRDYWPVSASTGDPVYYARKNNTEIMIAPTPVSTINGEVAHITRPTTLTSASPNNYFSDFAYDLLFYACMVESLLFMKDYQASTLYDQKYQQLLQLQQNQARRSRRDDMEVPANPAGGENTVIPNTN